MCTNPIQLEKRFADGSSRTYSVPCGQCPECRAKYQSEFAALSVLEANKAGSLAFITLTYDNSHIPVFRSVSESIGSVYHFADVHRGSCCPAWMTDVWNMSGCSASIRFTDGSVFCPSLYREDVKKFLKRYRQDYFRRYGERLDFRFSCFGEYGEKYHRPHYHMLIYGLSRDEVHRLCAKWGFGFTAVEYVERFNSDGSDAFVKVSRYVSKYISKSDFLPQFVRDGFAEKPRRQSSVRLGRRDLAIEQLRNFI